eukprot:3179353-Lingulodinium_polyedra.AAC.1
MYPPETVKLNEFDAKLTRLRSLATKVQSSLPVLVKDHPLFEGGLGDEDIENAKGQVETVLEFVRAKATAKVDSAKRS